MWMCKAKKRRNKNALTHMFGVLDWRDVSRCIIKKSRILSYFWLCSRSGRSAKQRSESALTHMFCVLDWHDVSRSIIRKKFMKSHAAFVWVHAGVDPQSGEAKALSLTCCVFSSDMMYQDPSFEKSSWNLTLLLFEFMDGQLRELNRKYRRISWTCVLDWRYVNAKHVSETAFASPLWGSTAATLGELNQK